MRIALIPGAGAAVASSVANSFQLTVAPTSQNLTALNATGAVDAREASVGWGRSLPQAAIRSAAAPCASIRLNMVSCLVRWWFGARTVERASWKTRGQSYRLDPLPV